MTRHTVPISKLLGDAAIDWLANPACLAYEVSEGAYIPADHHWLLARLIARAVFEDSVRALVQMPPQHGKSEMCSHWGPVWALEVDPGLRIGVASYEARMASSWGRRVRNTITENGDLLTVRLAEDSQARDVWHTNDPQGLGGMVTTGIGGPLTGRRLDLLVIDDPVKNADVARSQVYRDAHWEWWTTTAQTRLSPGGSVIVVQTRWHEDDLSGRLEAAGGWEVIRLPAIAQDADPLGRKPGEALWPAQYPADCPKFVEAQRYPRAWSALYQQQPHPPAGAVFRAAHWRYFREETIGGALYYILSDPRGERRIPAADCWVGQTADTALEATAHSDWTVVTTWAVTPDRDLLLRDVARARLEVPDQLPFLIAQRSRFPGLRWQAVERKASGHGLIQAASRRGVPLKALEPGDRDKVTRATPLAIMAENGKVYHKAGAPWLAAYEAELLAFPHGTHDDQVDPSAYMALEVQEQRTLGLVLL